MVAVVADLMVLLEFKLVEYDGALRAFGPETLWHLVFGLVFAKRWLVENPHNVKIADLERSDGQSLAAHDSDDNYLLGSSLLQCVSAFMNCRSGCEYIVDQNHTGVLVRLRLKRTFEVLLSLRTSESRLGGSGPGALEKIADRQSQ